MKQILRYSTFYNSQKYFPGIFYDISKHEHSDVLTIVRAADVVHIPHQYFDFKIPFHPNDCERKEIFFVRTNKVDLSFSGIIFFARHFKKAHIQVLDPYVWQFNAIFWGKRNSGKRLRRHLFSWLFDLWEMDVLDAKICI